MSTEPKSVTRRYLGGEAKILILKEHLVEKKPVADVCETHGISPAQFYRWPQKLFLNGCLALERKGAGFRGERQLQRQISDQESKLVRKNEALSELMEGYVALKKRNGGR